MREKGKILLERIICLIQEEAFKNQSRKTEKDFTRNRKVGFVSLVYMLLRMVRKTTQLELDEFRELFMPESAETTTYTKQSFSEARQKRLPMAFTRLNEELISGFYEEDDFKTYKGFRLLAKGIRYVMRSSTSFYKEVINTSTLDEIVKIEITSKRASSLKKQGTPIEKGTVLEFRVIKVELSNGETEILLTNTTSDELSYEESKPLYFKRWGIETRFDELKHTCEMENFSGEKPLLIEQDFHATVFLSNIASILEQEAEAELRKTTKKTQV